MSSTKKKTRGIWDPFLWEIWEKAQIMTQNHSTWGRRKLELHPSASISWNGGGLLHEGHHKRRYSVHASVCNELCCEIPDQDLRTSIHTSMNISPSSKSQPASSVKWEVTGPLYEISSLISSPLFQLTPPQSPHLFPSPQTIQVPSCSGDLVSAVFHNIRQTFCPCDKSQRTTSRRKNCVLAHGFGAAVGPVVRQTVWRPGQVA